MIEINADPARDGLYRTGENQGTVETPEDIMQNWARIIWRNLDRQGPIETRVRRRVQELETVHPYIVSCDLTIEAAARESSGTAPATVRLRVGIPGPQVDVTRRVHEAGGTDGLRLAIDEAFRSARGRLRGRTESVPA